MYIHGIVLAEDMTYPMNVLKEAALAAALKATVTHRSNSFSGRRQRK